MMVFWLAWLKRRRFGLPGWRRVLWAWLPVVLAVGTMAVGVAQGQSIWPTPIVLSPTPPATGGGDGTPTPTPGAGGADRFEPNDTPDLATALLWGVESDLTLVGADEDWFRLSLKAGQHLVARTAVTGWTDTRLALWWGGQIAVENDDRSPIDVGSELVFTAPADGWALLQVRKATAADGVYALTTQLLLPSATPTASATPTPTTTPTATPTATATAAPRPTTKPTAAPTAAPSAVPTVAPTATPTAMPTVVPTAISTAIPTATPRPPVQTATPRPPVQSAPPTMAPPTMAPPTMAPPTVAPQATLTETVALTATAPVTTTDLPLSVTFLGRRTPVVADPPTWVRLLIYYDADNDRAPGPGEGIPNVSVLAVDARGRRLARAFTDAQGEARFSLSGDAANRLVVPFVPGWSARLRPGARNDELVLGLPAVRLPVFLPVVAPTGEDAP